LKSYLSKTFYSWLALTHFCIGILSSCESDVGSTSPTTPPPQGSVYDWSEQSSNTILGLNDVFFIDNNTGWVVGDETLILSTSNGGTMWPAAPVTFAQENIHSVFFIDNQKGWFVANENTENPGGNVLISGNGGSYPEIQKTVDTSLNTVFFVNALTGWSAGNDGLLLHTTDGGLHWTSHNLESSYDIYDLHFQDEKNGWLVTDSARVYRTRNGIDWQPEAAMIETNVQLRSVFMLDTLHGWACGNRNTVLKRTQEPGQPPQWVDVNIDEGALVTIWNSIFFIDAQNGWVVGEEGRVFKTTDGGNTWNREIIPIRTHLNSIYMISSTKGWAVGEEGVILTYTPRN